MRLPAGAKPVVIRFTNEYVAPPQGTLQGFELANGEVYFAEIQSYSNAFDGYRLIKTKMCPTVHLTDIYVGPSDKAYYMEKFSENGKCGYRLIEGSYQFTPTGSTSLVDIRIPVTGQEIVNWEYETCTEATDWVTGVDGVKRKTITHAGSKFYLEDKNGNIIVTGEWKAFSKCAACKSVAEKALQDALNKARAKNGGKLTEKTTVVGATEKKYGPAGSVFYTEMKLEDIIKNLAETYNSLLENVKVPVAAWEPGKTFYVRDETAVISGAIDQGLEELKDIPDLVGLGLTLASDPEGAAKQLEAFKQQMSWDKARSMGFELAKGAVFADEFEKGGKYALHGTGRAGVVLAKAVATGGLLAVILDAPNVLKKKLDDIAALLVRLKSKLKNADLASALEMDLGNDELFDALDADNELVKSWEVLHNAEKPKLKLAKEALEKVKELLTDAKVQKALGANYADELSAICKAQGFLPHGGYGPKSLVSHLDDLKTFFTKFEGKEDMAEMIKAMKNGNEYVQDGLQHTLDQLNGLDVSSVKQFDVEFDVEGFDCPKTACRLDVEMNGNNPRFYEYKSYQDASRISVNQFTAYLSRVSSMSEMRYVFNAAKLSTEQAREGMKIFMKTNKVTIFDSMPENVRQSLGYTGLTARSRFEAALENTGDQIYSFISSN